MKTNIHKQLQFHSSFPLKKINKAQEPKDICKKLKTLASLSSHHCTLDSVCNSNRQTTN